MISKLLILLLNTGILVHSGSIIVDGETYNKLYNMFYGWDLMISIDDDSWTRCFGTFIAPRVYITDPVCLESKINLENITGTEIFKEAHGETVGKRIAFNISNINYSEDLDETFNKNKRKIAVVLTNEPVEPEEDKNGYVKINSNLDDIDVNKCFIPFYNGSMIKFTYCSHVYFDNRYGNPANIYCLSNHPLMGIGSGFFCTLKSNPEVDVLVGVIAGYNTKFTFWPDSDLNMATVENISGLNDTIFENVNDILHFLNKTSK